MKQYWMICMLLRMCLNALRTQKSEADSLCTKIRNWLGWMFGARNVMFKIRLHILEIKGEVFHGYLDRLVRLLLFFIGCQKFDYKFINYSDNNKTRKGTYQIICDLEILIMKQQLLNHYDNTTKRKWWQKVLRRHIPYQQLKDRTIINNVPDQDLPDNSIQTAKYHLASFFFFNLFYQFTKPSNVYFLIIGILQIIPQITVSQGKPTMFIPLTLVVVVSMIKDFSEDWKRHLNDKKQNNSQVLILGEPGFVKRKWQDIKVGNIVKIAKDQYLPCDLLLLKHGKQGTTAFVQTKNLDGETNLKLKRVPECLDFLKNEEDRQIGSVAFQLAYEKPNPFLTTFNGNLKLGQKKYNLQANNLMLRGCSLKINSYAIGLCIYNGHETKVMLNSGQPKAKRSKLEQGLNFYFKVIFVFQIVVTLICSIIYGVLTAVDFSNLGYVALSSDFFLDSIYTWGSWFIQFSYFIPISLLVTLQVVRFGQGKILESDKQCQFKGKPAEVQTSSVNQQLGQIQYVLTDKTGTLTQNKMDFKCLYVSGQNFGNYRSFPRTNYQGAIQGQSNSVSKRQTLNQDNDLQYGDSVKKNIIQKSQKRAQNDQTERYYRQFAPQKMKQQRNIEEQLKSLQQKYKSNDKIENVDFSESQKQKLLNKLNLQNIQFDQRQRANNDQIFGDFNSDSKSNSRNRFLKQPINYSLIHLALCHNAICDGKAYSSSSPDQIALINFAKYMGYVYKGKNAQGQLQVDVACDQNKIPGGFKKLKFKLLHILQFSSDRKRMSVICRQIQTAEIIIFCKGADDVILQRVNCKDKQKGEITEQLIEYGNEGLRTLVLAYKTITDRQYQEWNQKYQQAIIELTQDRLDKIYKMQSEIEKNMILLGATAIEDKLQENVKVTIQELKKAGIKVWMLTGDKKETAVSIGYSCGLIDKENCQKITLDCEAEHAADLISNLQGFLPYIKTEKVYIISGDLIRKIDQVVMQKLSNLLKNSKSVICCRVSPKDKQWVTNLVKKWGTTLSIGDGANDVNMINQADVGVGVRGIQGSQATRAADYIISQFQVLNRLIIYHGLNFFHRNANVCTYILYKNILVTIPILAYGTISMESATFIYDIWILQFYNIFYTSLPIILFGLVDTRYDFRNCIKFYYQGQKSSYFNRFILIRQLISSLVIISIMVFIIYYGSQSTVSPQGYEIYGQMSGMLVFSIIIITINIRIFTISNQLSILQVILIIFGIVSYYITYLLVEILLYTDVKNTLNHQLSSPLYWLYIGLFIVVLEGYQYLVVSYYNLKPHEKSQEGVEVSIEMQEQVGGKAKKDIAIAQSKMKQQKQMNKGFAFAQDQLRSLQF